MVQYEWLSMNITTGAQWFSIIHLNGAHTNKSNINCSSNESHRTHRGCTTTTARSPSASWKASTLPRRNCTCESTTNLVRPGHRCSFGFSGKAQGLPGRTSGCQQLVQHQHQLSRDVIQLDELVDMNSLRLWKYQTGSLHQLKCWLVVWQLGDPKILVNLPLPCVTSCAAKRCSCQMLGTQLLLFMTQPMT